MEAGNGQMDKVNEVAIYIATHNYSQTMTFAMVYGLLDLP